MQVTTRVLASHNQTLAVGARCMLIKQVDTNRLYVCLTLHACLMCRSASPKPPKIDRHGEGGGTVAVTGHTFFFGTLAISPNANTLAAFKIFERKKITTDLWGPNKRLLRVVETINFYFFLQKPKLGH